MTPESPSGIKDRFLDLIERAAAFARRPATASRRAERILLGVAVAVFVGAAVFAFRAFPDENDILWLPIVLAAVLGTPVAIALNAMEFQASGLALGHRFEMREAMRVTVIGSAANLLPIPGSVIVRVRALAQRGSSYMHAITASAGVGALFVGVTILIAGLAQLMVGAFVLALAWVVGGVLVAGVGFLLLRRRAGRAAGGIARRVVVIESAFVLTGAFRLFLILLGLGWTTDFSDAVALTLAGVLATATGFFPAGLGMKELLVAGISPLVGIPAVAGLTAAVVDRLFRFVVAAVVAGSLWVSGRGPEDRGAAPHPQDPTPEETPGRGQDR